MARRKAFFNADWTDMQGNEGRRATRLELREAYRLWATHSEIREATPEQLLCLSRSTADYGDSSTKPST